jgi:hypothetical protein
VAKCHEFVPLLICRDSRSILEKSIQFIGLRQKMNTLQKRLQSLGRRAAAGDVEVEHLVEFAVRGDKAAVSAIKDLSKNHNWPLTKHVGGARVVPLARWAEVVCVYLEEGCDGLIRHSQSLDEDAFSFAVSIFEELKTADAVAALAKLAGDASIQARALKDQLDLADAINLTCSFDEAPAISDDDAIKMRGFLHDLIPKTTVDSERARIVCALRGVGNADSIERIAGLSQFNRPWSNTQSLARKAIENRIRQ